MSGLEPKIEIALAAMHEARESHKSWADYLGENPEEEGNPAILDHIGMSLQEERQWVANYDLVIELLEKLRQWEP